MSDQTKSRFAIDLDDLERQLRQTAGSQPKAASADPLAELARIVGQDDPFKAIFNEKKAPPKAPVQEPEPAPMAGEPPQRAEPSLDELLRSLEGPSNSPAPAVEPAPAKDPLLDEFDAMLRDELRGAVSPDSQTVTAQTASPPPAFDDLRAEPMSTEPLRTEPLRTEPLRDDPFMVTPEPVITASASAPEARIDDFDSRLPQARDLDELRTAPLDPSLQPPPPADYPEPPAEQSEDMRSLEPRQPRKGLVIAGALLGVAALGVGAVVGLRGIGGGTSSPPRSGEPPVIRAEAGPARVQPRNPGGVEIPNQNKQIYERTPEQRPGDTRVVNREEQPIDVQAAARAAPRVILPSPGGQPTPAPAPTPAGTTATVPAGTQVAPGLIAAAPATTTTPDPAATLGEPRRVRTVSVRPDGTIAGAPPAAAPASPAAAPPAATTATPRPQQAAPAAPPAQPRPAPRPAAEEAPARPAAPPRQQVAAAPPTQPAPRAEPREAPAGGGFMVQLGAPGSEAEARSTFAALQRRYGDALSGDSPVIRRADVSGRTVYRLRVGPFSRSDAAEKCQAIQAAGGQCFVAAN